MFIRPEQHTLPDGLQAVSGSDAKGGCAMECVQIDRCQCPDGVAINSALIDGVCPASVDHTDPEYARDFFTVSRNGDDSVLIGFKWDNRFILRGVELKLFNCETLFTNVHTINVWRSIIFPSFSTMSVTLVGSYVSNENVINCNYVTTIVIPTNTTSSSSNYFIEFTFPPGDSNTGVYIAEVQFSDSTIVVPEVISSSLSSLVVPLTSLQSTQTLSSTTELSIPAVTSTMLTTGQFTSSSMTVISTSQSITTAMSSNTLATSSSTSAIFTTSSLTATTSSRQTSKLIEIQSTTTTTTLEQTTATPSPTPLGMSPTDPPTETTPQTTPPLVIPAQPSDSQIGPIVGSLVAVIGILLLIILVGICLVGFFLNKKLRKSDIRHLQHVISESNESLHEMNPRYSFANNQYYEETVHRRGGTATTDGYFEVDITASTEPLYLTVDEKKIDLETISNKCAEDENFYDTIREEPNNKTVPPYTKVKVEAPLVPKKTPELYHDLKIESEMESKSTSSLQIPGITVFDNKGSEIETIKIKEDDPFEKITDSASVHSCLASLTKPVLSMDSNPTYRSHDLDEPQTKQELPDEMYANPDTIDNDSNPEDSTNTDTMPPPKPPRPYIPSLTEPDEVYTDIDKEVQSDKVENVIYNDPDAPLKPAVVEDIYTNPDLPALDSEIIYSEADPFPATISTPTAQEQTSSLTNDDPDEIYTDPDARRSHLDNLPPIYDSTYQESTVASIFDPDSVSPVYENMIDDDDLFPYAPLYSDLPTTTDKPLELTSANIRPVKVLGSGCFGKVVLAQTVGLSLKDLKLSSTDDDKTKSIQVAIKTLKATASSSTKESFEKECKFMSRLDHPYVIRFLGVCRTDTPYIMMEYLKHGDLNTYLEEIDSIVNFDTQNPAEISIKILIRMCSQIADAMNYLASRNFIHRDLAARNCLVGENNVVKLSDFGMSRSLYESHYYIIKGRAVLPVRWMASECFSGKFSVNSDIWAFGVTMWEIFTLTKELPYGNMSDAEVAADARKGPKRLPLDQPASCPKEVYDVMLKCWAYLPKARATFEELFKELSLLISDN